MEELNEFYRKYRMQKNMAEGIPEHYKEPVIKAILEIKKTRMTEENSKVLYEVYNAYVVPYKKKDYKRNTKCRQMVLGRMRQIADFWTREKKLIDGLEAEK